MRLCQPVGPISFEHQRKPSGGIRTISRLSPRDEAAYEALVGRTARSVESRLRPWVLANRAPKGRGTPTTWQMGREAWRRTIRRALASPRPPAVLVGDVRDFYGSVRPGVVASALRECGADPSAASAVEEFLQELGEWGVCGLPVGPEPSGLLANAVLARADDALAKAGLACMRWVDDVVGFAASEGSAERALEVWRRELALIGLQPHAGKSVVLLEPAQIRARLLGSSPSDAG